MHRMPETITTTIGTALAQARYEGNGFVAYLLEMALMAASEPAKADCRVDLSETGQDRPRAVA
jgi:hypothetical protein